MDFSLDIRTNLHLINQVKAILTVDTSTLWLAKALGKEPYVFFGDLLLIYKGVGGDPDEMLGVKNLIPNTCGDVNDIIANDIVYNFLSKQVKYL